MAAWFARLRELWERLLERIALFLIPGTATIIRRDIASTRIMVAVPGMGFPEWDKMAARIARLIPVL
jgi:hypothetical protein